MGEERIKEERLSGRQLAVAAFAGGWAPGAAAGAYGWQGAALGVPAVMLFALAAMWLQRRVTPGGARFQRWCCALWGFLLLCRGFARCGARIELTGGGENGTAAWIVLLLAAPLLWMALGRAGAFFRMAELCAMAVLVTVFGVLVWGAFSTRGEYLLLPAVSVAGGFWAVVEAGGTFLFLLPYINKTAPAEGDGRRGLLWLTVLTAGTAILAAVTAGVLSPPVAALVEAPFFTMTAALGQSFRVEGLISSLWILSDMIYLGLLAGVGLGKGKRKITLPAVLVAAAAVVGIFSSHEERSFLFWGVGTAVFAGAVAVLPAAEGIISGWYRKRKTTSCGRKKGIKKVQEN